MHPRPAFTIRRPILLATLWWAIQAVPVAGQLQEPMDTVDVLAELITVEDGLPQGMVQCMAQDKAGYLWFGTRGGLARSDGYGFTIYQHDDKDSNSISSNIVRCVLEDRQGLLWLGFESGAVDRFDPRTGTFMHVVRDPNGGLGPVPEIRSMAQDHNGNIWIHAISGGLRVAREGTPDPRPLLEDPRKVFPRIAWPEQVHGIGVAGTGDVWIAFGDSLMVVDTETKQCTQRWRGDYLALASDNPTELQTLTPDAEGSGMWLKRADEFYHFDGGKDRSIPLIDHAGRIPPTIYAVQVLQGSTWISASMSCFRSKKVDGRMEYVRFREIHGKRIKPEMSVIRFLEDRSGTIWAGTNGYGVLKVTRIRQRFHHLPDVATVYKASTSGALALAKAEDDHWTDATGRITQGNVFSSLRAHGLMATPNVWAMDPQGRVWISTAVSWYVKSELTVIDPAGGMAFPPIVPAQLATRSIYPGQGDDIWAIATLNSLSWGGAVELLRIDTRTQRLIRRYPFAFGERVFGDVSAFELAPDSSLWLVTNAGLYQLIPSTGAWEHIQHDDSDPRSLPTDRLIGICFDPHDPVNLLWIGTGGSGLLKFDRRSGVVEQYTTKEGLPSNVVYGILPDERGNLWFSTDMGLCRMDPRTKELKRFTFEDGLVGNEFNTRATGATADGRMFFGGPMGTTWFRPEEFYEVDPPSPTVLTGLRLTNVNVAVGSFMLPNADGPLLAQAIEYVRAIVLPFDQRMITFSFACMDHTAPQKNTFRYRLEGFDKEWIEAGIAHEATFTNLDPGTYAFRVQGRNSEGTLDEQGASIQLIITPPWWGTWWFRIAALLAFGGAFYGLYRYRLAQAVKVVRVRESIARDLHDEIGSTLSSVQLYSAVAQRKANGHSPETSELLGRITESTTEVMEAMNDIVWAVNADNDNMAQVVQRMNSYAVRMTEAKECTLQLKVEPTMAKQHLGMTQRKNLYLIFKEAVNNAVKYSGCANLTIELREEDADYLLRVQDDGVGFAVDGGREGNLGGNGLGNMHRRAQEMGGALNMRSTPGAGTTVELRFALEAGR